MPEESEQDFSLMTALETKLRATIQKYRMLSHEDGLLVAVSGGPDSVALLHLLSESRSDLGLRLAVAHLEHGIRGDEAREDARFVAGMAERLGLPFYLRHVDLPKMKAEKGSGNLEAMAREERYRFFAATAAELGVQKVATAHTRDDEVETLLMWLLRGSGRRGLGGMPPVHRIQPSSLILHPLIVIRPLIEASREEIVGHLAAHGLEYRTDRTNLDAALLRNWIRLRLLPRLRERIDARLDERLSHLADILREEERILDRWAMERLCRATGAGSLMRESLLQEEKAMQRRILRLWLETTLGDLREVDFHHVEEALRFITEGPPQGSLSFPRGWDLVKKYETISLEKRRRGRPVSYCYDLPREGELFIPEAGMRVRASRRPFLSGARPRDEFEALFDLKFLPETLTIRNFRAGDRFQPLGMRGHKKLKELFIEKRVPRPVRRALPLLLAGEEILWVPGYGRSESAKIGTKTRDVLGVRLEVTPGIMHD